jgi:Kef-type K+ transport system membrane component KefB
MHAYHVFKDLAIILLAAKFFGIMARKCKIPQVVGEIIAGLIIGPSLLGVVGETDFIVQMAEIGVVLIMFSAGLETNMKDLIKTGPKALAIACAGVFVPLALGTLIYMVFYGFSAVGSDEFFKAVFIGTIMTATSVGITVEALREMGYLKGTTGTTILSAAIIDDIIGIIVLTFVIGFKTPDSNPVNVLISTVLFFAFAIIVGIICYKFFKYYDKRHLHTRRIPIYGFVLCLAMAYIAEKFFGIADITGAYAAGIILSNLKDSEYIAEKMDVSSYMIFGPIFFIAIGLKTNLTELNMGIIWFALAFVVVALLSKIIGCGLVSRMCKFNKWESLKIGIGMMTRGEVALIVTQKGLSAGLVDSSYFTAVIMLILASSILTPVLLKLLYNKHPDPSMVE